MTMIATAKAIGRATSAAAAATVRTRGSPAWPDLRRSVFSTSTTDPSTIMPKSIAPRLIRFAEMPRWCMPTRATSSDSGITEVTTRAARQSPSMTSSTAITSTAPSARLSRTVRMVRPVRSARL